jgi:phospholipid/cholesterol/gamma-HCH transport system substrate-binding protein
MTAHRRRAAAVLFAAAVALTAAGCDLQPADIPVPGTGVGGPTYHLRIQFADVLNLPQGAKVIADGVRVGQLTGVTVVDPAGGKGYVVADVAIRRSVRLPLGTTAELRQETPLGDVHIALTTPAGGTGELGPDATIPLADTTQSPPIEDILARLATFVGSGAITDLQDIVRKMNAILPRDPADTARIAGTLGADLTDLADHTDSIHALVAGLRTTTEDGLLGNTPILDQLLTPYGVQHTTDSIDTTITVIFVLTALGPLAPSLRWLGPMLSALDGAAKSVVPMLFGARPLDTGSPSNLAKLTDLVQNRLVPFTERGPKVNLIGVGVGDTATAATPSGDRTDRVVDTLRMIGAVR